MAIARRSPSSCTGSLDRRTWLKIGGLSLGALVSGMNPSLARLFAAEEAGRSLSRDFSVILFWANGGPSHIDTFDLKPKAPAEIRGPFRPICTNVPGIAVNEQLPRLARLADKFALVRSLHHNRAEHSGGTHRFLTGYPSAAANLQNAEYPDIGSVVARELDGQATDVPLYGPDGPTERELRLIGEVKGKRVLDLGSGNGAAAITFGQQGAIVIALDGSTGLK